MKKCTHVAVQLELHTRPLEQYQYPATTKPRPRLPQHIQSARISRSTLQSQTLSTAATTHCDCAPDFSPNSQPSFRTTSIASSFNRSGGYRIARPLIVLLLVAVVTVVVIISNSRHNNSQQSEQSMQRPGHRHHWLSVSTVETTVNKAKRRSTAIGSLSAQQSREQTEMVSCRVGGRRSWHSEMMAMGPL